MIAALLIDAYLALCALAAACYLAPLLAGFNRPSTPV